MGSSGTLQRVVVEPNVLISAWISPHGLPRRILDAADAGRFEMVVCERLRTELSEVLSRERLRRYGPVERARTHVEPARRIGIFVEAGEEVRVVPDDPKDDYLVALARASGAYCIVSSDPHLTNLEAAHTPEVLTPREFWEFLEREPEAG